MRHIPNKDDLIAREKVRFEAQSHCFSSSVSGVRKMSSALSTARLQDAPWQNAKGPEIFMPLLTELGINQL